MQRFLASMTVADHPSLEVLLATQLSHRGLEMLEGGVQLLDIPESVSHTARCKRRAPYCLIQLLEGFTMCTRRKFLLLIMQQPTESCGDPDKWGFTAPFPEDQVDMK